MTPATNHAAMQSARDVIAGPLTFPVGHFLPKRGGLLADAILSALSAAGYAVVPIEPTEEMCRAGLVERHDDIARAIYRAMIAAAPASGAAKREAPLGEADTLPPTPTKETWR